MRKEGSGRLSKVKGAVEQIIEMQMQDDDETSVAQLQTILKEQGYSLSANCRTDLKAGILEARLAASVNSQTK